KWTNTADAGQGIVTSTTDSWSLLENGKEYVITCWVKASSASTFSLQVYGDSGDVVNSYKNFSVNTNWQKIVHIVTGDGQSNPRVRFFGRNNGVTYWVNCPKVEIGNKSTDWTPAPEDVDAAINNIEVGGRNLVEKTNQGKTNIQIDSSAGGGTWTVSEEIVDGVKCAKGTKNTTAVETWSLFNLWIYTPSKFRANQQYAISFKMKPSFAVSNKKLRFSTVTNQLLSTNSDTYSLVAGEWNHIKLVVTTLPDFDTILAGRATVHLRLGIEGNSSTGDTVLLKDIKIEEGNKSTDWSPAPEDISAEIATAKQEALTAASAAQTTANTANTAVGSLNTYVNGAFKDGVIDAAEAKAIEKYKNTLNEAMAKAEASYSKVYTNSYLSGTAKTALQNAKINLWGQRDTLISAINTAISGGTTTPAQKANVDSAFGTFNTLMNAFQNAIEEANKAIQVKLDNISKGYVDAVQVGGRNHIPNSSLKGTAHNVSGNLTRVNDPGGIMLTRSDTTSSSRYFCSTYFKHSFKLGDQITLSAWIRLESGIIPSNTSMFVRFFNSSGANVQDVVTLNLSNISGDWVRITGTGTITNSTIDFSRNIQVAIGVGTPTAPVTIQTKEWKLELGNRATDWTPAPEDVPSALDYLATAIQGSTDIEGGLVNTNVLMVKDTNGAVKGGISGLASDNIGFWTGGNYQAAINNNANVIFRKDGSFSLAGGKISGTASGNVTIDDSLITQHVTTNYIEGLELNFTRGKIGGFDINADSIGKEVSSSNLFLSNNRFYLRESGSVEFDVRNSNPYVIDIRDQSFRTLAKVGMRIRIGGSTTLNRALETYGEVLFMSCNGVYGIRINDDGIKKTTNGGQTWTAL
ncbi:MAG: hypothetical protein GX921_02215, partial [Bacteroidales bacterium]|nr:hypothetical protein [Bacteroidales bacterium]